MKFPKFKFRGKGKVTHFDSGVLAKAFRKAEDKQMNSVQVKCSGCSKKLDVFVAGDDIREDGSIKGVSFLCLDCYIHIKASGEGAKHCMVVIPAEKMDCAECGEKVGRGTRWIVLKHLCKKCYDSAIADGTIPQ